MKVNQRTRNSFMLLTSQIRNFIYIETVATPINNALSLFKLVASNQMIVN